MYIYKITNQINGKIYVGQTTRDLIQRKRRHYYDAFTRCTSYPLHKAFRKYGKEQFVWEIIETCYSLDELNKQEEFWIAVLNSLAPNGYNAMRGGNNKLLHPDTKLLISQAITGIVRSESTKQKLSIMSKASWANHREKFEANIQAKRKAIRVTWEDGTSVTFSSIREASQRLKCAKNTLYGFLTPGKGYVKTDRFTRVEYV